VIGRMFQWMAASPPRVLVFGFAAIIALGTALLKLPVMAADGRPTPLIDALFTAVSAVCVTGLTPLDFAGHWSFAGQLTVLVLVQVGGFGFMTLATMAAIVLRRRITLRERIILQESFNQAGIEGVVRLVLKVIRYTLILESAGAAVLTIRFLMDMPPARAVWFGVFHAVSFFNGAGFDLMGGFRSLTGYVGDPLVTFTAAFLILSGGLGIVVLSDLAEYRKTKRLSLHSKVVVAVSLFLILVGAITIFIFEYTNRATLAGLGFGEKLMAAFFQAVVPRSSGVSSLDIGALRQATQFLIVILMFIGASPGSAGGGIKTTTFAVLAGAVWSMIRGREDVVMFRYRLAQERVYKALTITMFALAVLAAGTMLLSVTENRHFLMILFEAASAFGTVGLSMGLTPELSQPGKIIVMLLMFVGRLGPLTLAYALGTRQKRTLYRYAEGKILIG